MWILQVTDHEALIQGYIEQTFVEGTRVMLSSELAYKNT